MLRLLTAALTFTELGVASDSPVHIALQAATNSPDLTQSNPFCPRDEQTGTQTNSPTASRVFAEWEVSHSSFLQPFATTCCLRRNRLVWLGLLRRKERNTATSAEASLSCLGERNHTFNLTRYRSPSFQINKERCRKLNRLAVVAKGTRTWIPDTTWSLHISFKAWIAFQTEGISCCWPEILVVGIHSFGPEHSLVFSSLTCESNALLCRCTPKSAASQE